MPTPVLRQSKKNVRRRSDGACFLPGRYSNDDVESTHVNQSHARTSQSDGCMHYGNHHRPNWGLQPHPDVFTNKFSEKLTSCLVANVVTSINTEHQRTRHLVLNIVDTMFANFCSKSTKVIASWQRFGECWIRSLCIITSCAKTQA